jgi:ElaB/YqjD/DUF883 family membrane-anchored ribosome-binding protein
MSISKTNGESHDLDKVVDDIAALRKDFAKLMEHVTNGAADKVSGQAHRLYGTLAAEGERSAALIARQVEERPLASLSIAFAIGFLGSRLLLR